MTLWIVFGCLFFIMEKIDWAEAVAEKAVQRAAYKSLQKAKFFLFQ